MFRYEFLLVVIGVGVGVLEASDRVSISGEILFERGTPRWFPEPSQLYVELRDISRMDAPSITVGHVAVDLKYYRPELPLKYTILAEIPDRLASYAVSAVINVGWTPARDGQVRKGDYLTDTEHPVYFYPGESHYTKDINVVHYTR